MVDVTVFELHLDGAEFTANAPGSNAEEETDTDAADSGPPLGLVAVVVLVVLLLVALVVRKLGGGE